MAASSRVSAEASSDPAARAWALEVVRTSAEESAIVRRSLCSSTVGAARKELEMGPACSSSRAAAAGVNAWSGVAIMMPLLGAAVADSWMGRIDCDWRIPAADGGAADCGLREQMQQVRIMLKKQVPGAAATGLPPITDFRHRAAIRPAQIDGHG